MKKFIVLTLVSLIVSILSHLFFLNEWLEGTYMAGPNDGLNQMLAFKQLIYENYTSGNPFYSFQLGLGGGIYGQLGYYYSTNLYFLVTIGAVYLLELLHIIETPNVLFWAQLIVFSSIVRMTIVTLLTTYVFRYFSLQTVPALVGAALYGSSAIYFRHVVYWEFFADAFLFVPLLIFGVEKIIREQKPSWFVFAVSLTLFNNFYFAYITLLFIGMYILIRWLIPQSDFETNKAKQSKLFILSGGLGFGIASIGFIPSVYAYLHNYRPSFNQERPNFDLSDNMLLDSRTFLLSGMVILFIFVFHLYKNRLFRLFATLTVMFILFHFSPLMGSVFNGFSAPRNRFEFIGYFVAGGLVACGIQFRSWIKKSSIYMSVILSIILYSLFALFDKTYSLENVFDYYMVFQAVLMIISFVLIGLNRKKLAYIGFISILLVNAGMMNVYQYDKLYIAGNINKTTQAYIQSENYASEEQMQLIEKVNELDRFHRIEWKGMDDRNNTPLIQGFNGTSVYSSILNEYVLYWYYHHLEIDMKRESISRYSGFGDRANLYSLMGTNYLMVHKGDNRNVPYGFVPYIETGDYQMYRNTNPLPFARTSSKVYSEESLKDSSIVRREHAMLDGIILENPKTDTAKIKSLPNLMNQVNIENIRSTYSEVDLEVTGDTGGINLNLSSLPANTKDLYVSFHLKNKVKSAPWFPLHVNNFKTSRKSRESFYRTGIYDITIRVPKKETISIRVPKGSYELTELELYAENYEALERASQSKTQQRVININGNKVHINIENAQNDGYLAIPVPYEKGWNVTVNGENKEILKANYAFLGVELEKGKNDIKFTYYPPYFTWVTALSILSFLLSVIWIKRRRKD